MGNRKSKLVAAVIEKPTSNRNIVAEHSEDEVKSSVAVIEPTVSEPTVTEPIVAEPVNDVEQTNAVVAEPTVAEPTVAEPTVAEPAATELTNDTIETDIAQPVVTLTTVLEPIQEVDESYFARPTIKSDSTRSLKITFMSANQDPYAYLPKKEPETISKYGKKFKKHQKDQKDQKHKNEKKDQLPTEQEEPAPSSTNVEEMD